MEQKRFILARKILATFLIVAIMFTYMPVNAVYGYVEEIQNIVEDITIENDISLTQQVIENTTVIDDITNTDIQDVHNDETNIIQEDSVTEQVNEPSNNITENIVKEEKQSAENIVIVENKIDTNTNTVIEEKTEIENSVNEVTNSAIDNTIINNEIVTDIENKITNNTIANTVVENSVSNTVIDIKESIEDEEEKNIEVITFSGTLTWKDNNNTYGTRPEKVTINLLKNGNLINSKEVMQDELGNWNYIFENLEKYDETNNEIKYTITINEVLGYEIKVNEEKNVEALLKEKTEFIGTKLWKDNNNAYKTRPEKITVNLLKNGTVTNTKEISSDESGNWNYKFEELEKYDENGIEISYTVTENEIPGYIFVTDENGNVVSLVKETANISGTANWEDNNNSFGKRPESISLNLYKEGAEEPLSTIAMAEKQDGTWSFVFENLEKYTSEGIKINYSISLEDIENYKTTITKISDNKIDITNTLVEEIELELTWQDILMYGPYMSMVIKYAEEYGEEPLPEEKYIYEKYREMVYGRGPELAAMAIGFGTAGFTEEELAIYNAYQEIIMNGGESSPIQTLDIEADGKYKGSEILRAYREGDSKSLRYLQYKGEDIRQTLKYVATTDGAAPKIGDKMAYCMNYERDFENDAKYTKDAWDQMMNDKKYKEYKPFFSKLYSELSYAVSIGCKEYGKYSSSGYSTKDFIGNYEGYSRKDAKWTEDYYATQTVIYVILNDYIKNFNDIIKAMNIQTDDETKTNIYNKLKEMYSGHPLNDDLTINSTDTNSSYNGAHQKAVLDAAKKMYDAVKEQRKVINDIKADGYDGTITITPEVQTLTFENGKYVATVEIKTTGTQIGSVNFSGPDGMETIYDKKTGLYTLKIPYASMKSKQDINITAKANFAKNKTVTYIAADSDNQNIAFFQENLNNTVRKSATAKLSKAVTISKNGQKTWIDNGNTYNTRPQSITISLYANSTFLESKTVTAADGWRWSFDNLPKYDKNNKEINYTVKENKVTGYNTIINGMNVTNALTGTLKVSGTKIWKDNQNAYSTRPASITVNLLRDGTKVDSKIIYSNGTDTWQYEFINLPKYDSKGKLYTYTISEENVTGYKTTYNENTIINKLEGKTEVKGIKTWKDNENLYGTRPETITVNLFRNEETEPLKTITVGPDISGIWNYEFTDLEKYDENGVLYKYTVLEDIVENYKVDYDGNNIINTLTGTTEVTGKKIWKDNNNAYITRPETITVNLFRNEETEPLETINVEPDLLGNWEYKFTELEKYDSEGKLYVYKITEDKVEKYETTIENVENIPTQINITNKLTDEIEIKGNKSWVDNNNAYGTRPKSINLILLANGKKVAEKAVEADKNGKWEFAFTNLLKYDDEGVKIKYTIEENEVLGYITDIETVSETETNLTNRLTGETIMGGSKIWLDNNNTYRSRPNSITVNLLANGKKIAEKEVTQDAQGNWNYMFSNLLKYDENGVKIKYTIEENAVLGYITEVKTINETETEIINTLSGKTQIKGLKIWEDHNNAYATRPDSIIVNLLANGEKIAEKEVTQDEEGHWEFIFEELEEYDDKGVKIEYAIAENPVLGYSTTIVGTNIINRVHERKQTTQLDLTPTTGKKNWLKNFIITAITSLFGMIFAKRRKLLGEGK